jgi:hypothetical protein
MVNSCIIKYIYLDRARITGELHDPSDFEYRSEQIEHTTFDDMREKAFGLCPKGFRCVEPIALRHEVLWGLGLGANGERDQLCHALEADEYGLIAWGKELSLCVDIVEDRAAIVG